MDKKETDIEFNGERFVPLEHMLNDEIAFEHFHRYYSVLELIKNKVVLDIACGEGYGSALLAKTAQKVYGVDIDEKCIQHARKKYKKDSDTIDFLQGRADKIPLDDHSVDVIISYETIEHLDEAEQKVFFSEIKRILCKNGMLIISTPEKTNYSERYHHINEFHKKEFSKDEFSNFLYAHFRNVNFYLQGYEIISAITEDHPDRVKSVKVLNWERQARSFSRKYMVAVCAEFPIKNESSLSSIVFQVDKDFLKVTDRICEMEAHILELGAWGRRLDNQVIELEKGKKENDNLLMKQLRAIETLKAEASDYNNIIQGQKQKIHGLYQQLDSVNNRLTEIYDSDGWKLLKKYYNLKGRLLPEDSERYKILKKAVNKIRGKKDIYAVRQVHQLPKPKKEPKKFQPQSNSEPFNIYNLIELPLFESPAVSIVLPAYNGWGLTYKCLESVKENTLGVSYEIIIADDASTDETKNIGKYIKNVVIIRNEKNLEFLHNCNNAAIYTKGKYILFLNNDTEVKPGWLSSLVDLMEKDENIGMTGSKLIYPDGRLQEAGGIIWNDASGWNFGHKQDPDAPEFNYVKEVDYISGASILVRASLWKEIGGFDTLFSPAYCEDSDLAFEVRKRGYKVIYQPLSEVVHYEGYTHGTDKNEGIKGGEIKAYQKLNNQKFQKKWERELIENHFPNGENVFWARDKSQGKKTILVIDHYVPQIDKDAGSKTVFEYLKLFTSLNFNVKFIGDNFFRHEPYTTILQQMGIEVLYGTWYANNWQQWIGNNQDKFDYVLLNRPHISIKYIDFIKKNTKAKILYYGHDLHFARELKQYEIEKNPKLLQSSRKWKEIETYIFNNSDIVLSPSDDEKRLISELVEDAKICTIRPYIFENLNEPITDFSDRKHILFVGGFTHKPNVDAVLWFVEEIWPLVRQEIEDIKFIIVGSNAPKELLGVAADDIEIKGFVSDEELNKIYSQVKAIVVPLRYGAGVKGKTVDAMYNGIPLVTTDFGVEGLPGDVSFISAKNGAAEFAGELIRLYRSPDKDLEVLSKMEIDYIRENFHFNVARRDMSLILNIPL